MSLPKYGHILELYNHYPDCQWVTTMVTVTTNGWVPPPLTCVNTMWHETDCITIAFFCVNLVKHRFWYHTLNNILYFSLEIREKWWRLWKKVICWWFQPHKTCKRWGTFYFLKKTLSGIKQYRIYYVCFKLEKIYDVETRVYVLDFFIMKLFSHTWQQRSYL